jgi:hypothetical protein
LGELPGFGVGFVTLKANKRGVRNMNIKQWRPALLVPVTLVFLTACPTPPPNDSDGSDDGSQEILVNNRVDLLAAKDATKIEPISPDHGCRTDGTGKKGCVQFDKNEVGTIDLRLNPQYAGRTCQTNPPSDWVITRVELSPSGNPVTEKGIFPTKSLPWMVDAFPGINPKNGTLYFETDISKATQSVSIVDLNNHRGGSLNTAYYQVTATSCAAGIKPITIDPAIQNKGK